VPQHAQGGRVNQRPRNVSVSAPQALNPMNQTERGSADFRNIDFDANRHVAEIDLVSSFPRRHQQRSMATRIAAEIR